MQIYQIIQISCLSFLLLYLILLISYYLEIITNPFFAPGTIPLRPIRLEALSTNTTSTFLTLTLSFPILPAIFFPLYTLPGVVPAPIDPGCLGFVDCP